jgi:phosphatidate phosphatase PAH1
LIGGCATLPPSTVALPPAPNSQFVAFDIDGTLTPHNLLTSRARPDAAAVVNAFASKGYAIVYITTRVPGFQLELPSWLRENGFPAGHLHAAQTATDRAHAAEFKSRMLVAYTQLGWRLSYAFGDSATDFEAYRRAGLSRDRIFALRRAGHKECEQGVYHMCLDGWSGYLQTIHAEVPEAGKRSPDGMNQYPGHICCCCLVIPGFKSHG